MSWMKARLLLGPNLIVVSAMAALLVQSAVGDVTKCQFANSLKHFAGDESAVIITEHNYASEASFVSELSIVYQPLLRHSSQRSDPEFNTRVAQPAYSNRHPLVLFDEAHNNDTSSGRYKPFTDLIGSDGYQVMQNSSRFSSRTLKGYQVVVIVNASGPSASRDNSPFTPEECDAVSEWVSHGGALLVITDHAPYSSAVAELANRFGVELTKGFTVEPVYFNKESGDQTELVFTRGEGLLGEHAITNGRDANERINRVISFTGTSLKGPQGSVALLKLSDKAIDVVPPDHKPTSAGEAPPDHKQISAAGRAQGVALGFGKGRIVVFAEAAMLTAQVTPGGVRFGMSMQGTDNRQLALNTMHWLSGLLK